MPDLSLDPSALSVPHASLSSSVGSKSILSTSQTALKTTKPSASAQRLDLESLYTNLKSAIGEYWGEYKEAVSLFVLGQLNQDELALRTDHFISGDAVVEHLHNQLMIGIFFNTGRDPPEPGVASWVSANDKPIVSSKATAGDAAELRLKTEIMQLPARDRRRLKDITEADIPDPVPSSVTEYSLAKQFKSSDNAPPTAGGKTNWDLEIRKRYAQPLAAESGEFPDTEVISGRINPICYGEALPDGAASNCASFMASATEYYIKEVLSAIYSRSRTNITGGSVNGIVTYRFRKQLQHEEDSVSRGQLEKVTGTGLLPIQAREDASRPGLAMHDLKLAVKVGEIGLGQYPLIIARIMNSYEDGEFEAYQNRKQQINAGLESHATAEKDRVTRMQSSMQGPKLEAGTDQNGSAQHLETIAGYDEDEDEDWGWDGGSAASRTLLNSSLDSCLVIGM